MRTAGGLLVLAVLALASCGPQGKLVERRPAIPEQAGSTELGGSPGRTALAWWDAMRARDSEALVARLTPAARRTINLDNLAEALRLDLGRWAEASEANVLYTERRPGHATVYMRIDVGGLVGSRPVKGGAVMLALPFVSRDGAWLIENAAWLRGRADSFVAVQQLRRRMERQARQNAREGEGGK